MSTEETFRCAHCDRIVHKDNGYHYVYALDDYICDNCFLYYYFRCTSCGDITHIDNHEQDDFCHDCYEPPYPDVSFCPKSFGEKFFGDSPDNVYFGLELETECCDGEPNQFGALVVLKDKIDKDYIATDVDGSLDQSGVEFKLAPSSFEFLLEDGNNNLGTVISTISKYGGEATYECGVHIHIDKRAFSNDAHLSRFHYLAHNNKKFFFTIGGRDVDQFDSWCKWGFDDFERAKCEREYHRAITYFRCHGTHEVRIFKGSLNINELALWLELLHAMIYFTALNDSSSSLVDFKRFVNKYDDKYPTLKVYLDDELVLEQILELSTI